MGLVTGPHTRNPERPQEPGVGPRLPVPRMGCWEKKSARPRTTLTEAEGAPPGAPKIAQHQFARLCAVGLVTGPHTRNPPCPPKTGSRPWLPAARTGSWGGRSAQNRTAHMQTRGAPSGRPLWRPHSAQRQLAKACAGRLMTGPHTRDPRALGRIGQQAPATCPKDGWLGEGECPTPDTAHGGMKHAPCAPLCGSHSAQRYLARACTVGLLKSPHARIPRAQGKHAAGPGGLPQGRAVRGGRVRIPGHP